MRGGALCWACNGLETSRPAQSLEMVGVRWWQGVDADSAVRRLGGHWHPTLGGAGPRGQHTPCFLGAVLDWPCLPMGQGGQPELQELPAGKQETQVTLQLGQRDCGVLRWGGCCSGSGSLHPSLPRPPWDPLALDLDASLGYCSLVGISVCHLICLAALSVILGW